MFVYDTVSARRAGATSTGSAVRGGFAGTPTAGMPRAGALPGFGDYDDILAAVGDGLYVQSVTGVHSGVNAVSGDFSVGAEGLTIRGGALDQPVREVTVAVDAPAHAPVGRTRGFGPAMAARRRRGADPGHRRHAAERRLARRTGRSAFGRVRASTVG